MKTLYLKWADGDHTTPLKILISVSFIYYSFVYYYFFFFFNEPSPEVLAEQRGATSGKA